MDEELANLQLDRPARGKSQEELRKHTLDTQFESRPIERSLFLLTKGDDIQKLSVISIVPTLLTMDSQATITRILPKIHQQLASSPCEFHLAASKMYATLMERKIPVNLLHVVIQGIDSRDPIIANAWLDTLVKVIPTLTDAQIKNEVLPLAMYKASMNQSIFYRVASCKILGKIAVHPKLQPADVKRDILPITQSLCQDCNHEVRAAICAQLSYVAEGLGAMFPKGNLLPVLVDLAQDVNSIVRAASVQAAVLMLPLLTPEIKKSTMFPLIKHLYQKSVEQSDISCVTIAKGFGGILEGLQTCLPVSDSMWFLECFSALANKGLPAKAGDNQYANASQDVLCRQHCASNLPAVAYYVLTELPGHVDHINNVCRSLTSDPCYIVRRTAAGCIHEVLKILGPLGKALKSDIVRLFKDDAEEVLQMVVPHLSSILHLFYTHGLIARENTNPSTVDICRGLMKCQVEITKGTNWRLLTKLLYQFEYLPNCVPGDFIHQHFTPSLVNLAVAGRAKPVRSQATRTLLVFLKYNTKEAQKKWLRETLVTNLCYANSCYTRHIYIRLCVHAIEIFSNRYFKEYFYASLLSLGEDKVSNIRLALVNLLPTLKNMLQPEDRKLQMIFENTVRLIETQEQDRDVIAYYQLRAKEATVPLRPAQVQERQIEERRKQEEEESIAAGKWIPIMPKTTSSAQQTVIATDNPAAPPLENSQEAKTPLPRASPLALQRTSPNASTKSLGFAKQSRLSDMSILEQHFYTDAGVNLPVSTANDDQNNTETISTSDLLELKPKVELNNATDDAKANLQRINVDVAKLSVSKSESVSSGSCKIVNRNKRHSIVFPAHDYNGEHQKKMLNRRSLSAIPTRETSRIPVSSKSTSKIKRSDSVDAVCNNSDLNANNKQVTVTETIQKSNTNRPKPGKSNIACFKSSLNSSNKENLQKSSGLPVLMRKAITDQVRK